MQFSVNHSVTLNIEKLFYIKKSLKNYIKLFFLNTTSQWRAFNVRKKALPTQRKS